MSRAILRYMRHTIRHEPDSEVLYEAFCAASGCEESSDPQLAQEAAQDWCLRHTGRTGHDLFRRAVIDG
ncbi:DUF7848 domain-containing protein [Streptomyces brasiliensis]|uniref:DUF7848 domain-containing protein n=1 Tax=Streptomyces brasiliensis TaxID=1954 RepID=UPI004032B8C5